MITTLRQIKHNLKQASIKSYQKNDEFDPKVYDDREFKNRAKHIYKNFAKVLFDEFRPVNFMDIGCATALVPYYFKSWGVDAHGIEGADAAYKFMQKSIKPKIHKLDLRSDLTPFFYKTFKSKFELVNFTEVAEHLKPENEGVMLQNVKLFTGSFVSVSWSSQWDAYKGTKNQTHFNPRPKKYVIKTIESIGFKYRPEISNTINNNLNNLDVYSHWKNNMMVFSRQ